MKFLSDRAIYDFCRRICFYFRTFHQQNVFSQFFVFLISALVYQIKFRLRLVVGGNVLVLVLTGMGKDGTDGARALKKKGAYVIAESKETCVIPGMPGAIVEAGLSDEVIPLYAIASNLVRLVK